ncbi:unnamed protein product, partial [Allacma fusca]
EGQLDTILAYARSAHTYTDCEQVIDREDLPPVFK